MALAVFKVWPLSFVGMLAITTDVRIDELRRYTLEPHYRHGGSI